jgi:hypothetical protein
VATFCSIVEAELIANRAGIRDKPNSMLVKELLLRIRYHQLLGLAIAEPEVYKLLQSTQHTLRVIYASPNKSTDEEVHQREFDLFKDQENLTTDFMGLTLEVGLPQYFEHDLGRMLPMKPHAGKTLNANYKITYYSILLLIVRGL